MEKEGAVPSPTTQQQWFFTMILAQLTPADALPPKAQIAPTITPATRLHFLRE
jgi:hypothetical protein